MVTLAEKLYLAPISPNTRHVLDIGTGETQYHTYLLVGPDLPRNRDLGHRIWYVPDTFIERLLPSL